VKGIVVVAALIVAVMVAIKDGRVLQSAGLTGECSHVAAFSGAWYEACRPGKLEGLPDLTKRGCKPAGAVGRVQYWSCPADVQPSDAGR
jgi:hypothetical protein